MYKNVILQKKVSAFVEVNSKDVSYVLLGVLPKNHCKTVKGDTVFVSVIETLYQKHFECMRM